MEAVSVGHKPKDVQASEWSKPATKRDSRAILSVREKIVNSPRMRKPKRLNKVDSRPPCDTIARMTPFEIILLVVMALGLGTVVVLQLKKAPQAMQTVDLSKDLARVERELEAEKKEKHELSGKNKQLFAEREQLKAELNATAKERDNLRTTVTKFEAKREQQEKDADDRIRDLKASQESLDKERERVIHEDEERTKEMEEERDRVWNDHENAVVAQLSDLCKQPQFQFKTYSNTRLPDDFDGSLKPDFLLEFLDQYVIFDAKASKAQSLQTYIDEAVKKTAEKIRKNAKIYPHVFLVVPTEAIAELKKLVYAKDEYYFYIVSREALAPILASLKRISTYELAESLDPQKRENIINMLSELATHISYRNAYELLLTKHGADTLERVARIDADIALEVEQKNAEKKFVAPAPSDVKRIASALTEQNAEISSLASPKAAVKKKHLDAAVSVIAQKLL